MKPILSTPPLWLAAGFALCVSSVPIDAAPQLRRGQAAAWAGGVSLDASGNDAILLKEPTIATAPLGAWQALPGIPMPDYSFAPASLPLWHPFALYDVPLDAISTGRSRIPRHNGDGAPQLGGTVNWLAVTVSVSSASTGGPSSLFQRIVNQNGNPGAELVSRYLDPAGVLPSEIGERTLLEASRSELGYGLASAHDIDGFDYALGMMTYNEPEWVVLFREDENEFYFSVPAGWADANPTSIFWYDGVSWHPPHGGDIYRMTWDPETMLWGAPQVEVPWTALVHESDDLDVDALDVDPENGVVVFSATQDSGWSSQLMIFQEPQGTQPGFPPVPLANSGGGRVTTDIDIADNDDEVDAVCTFDPELGLTSFIAGLADQNPVGGPYQTLWAAA